MKNIWETLPIPSWKPFSIFFGVGIPPSEIRERNQLSDSDLSGTGGVLRGVDGRWLESGQQKMAGIMAQSGQG